MTYSIPLPLFPSSVPTSPVIGVLVAIAVLIIIAIGVVIYRIYHRKTKTDYYHLRKLNARSKSVVATIALQEKVVFKSK